jgi:hypothetical protein
VVLDRTGVAVVYLAHALVLPPYRRTGLGALFRRVPIEIGQAAIGEAGLAASRVDLLLAAEMEPASLDDEASIVRLRAYGQDGFAAIAPAALGLALVAFAGVLWRSRTVSLASISAAVLLPLAVAFTLGAASPVFAAACAIGLFVVWSHRTNIQRLRAGTEPRLSRAPKEGAR